MLRRREEGEEPKKARWDHLSRIKLDVCKDCNDQLNVHFERPAKPHVRRLLDELQPITGEAVANVARWAAKTLILWHHPASVISHIRHLYGPPHNKHPKNRWTVPREAMIAMRDSGRVPDDVSLWMAVIGPGGGSAPLPDGWVVMEPGVRGGMVEFSLPEEKWRVLFHVMYHPRYAAENPVADAGLVTRLWPAPPSQLDIRALPKLDEATASQLPKRFLRTSAGDVR